MDRKQFILRTALGAGAAALPAFLLAQDQPKPDPLPLDIVREFVIAGHGNLAKTKEMLAANPSLLFSTYDWGKGDFETALEGAGHVGSKDVANFLIEAGARTNLFVLTMLGKTEIVKAFLEIYPAFINAKGPHGFTLLHHAQKGQEDASELANYLQSKGLKETRMAL